MGPENNGALTIPANICGNPAISIPVAPVDGLPVGMQVIGQHHEDALLLDLALVVERTCPWPLVGPRRPGVTRCPDQDLLVTRSGPIGHDCHTPWVD